MIISAVKTKKTKAAKEYNKNNVITNNSNLTKITKKVVWQNADGIEFGNMHNIQKRLLNKPNN